MRWAALPHLLFEEKWGPPPHVLIIHLGGNDLGFLQGKALIMQAKAIIALIKER